MLLLRYYFPSNLFLSSNSILRSHYYQEYIVYCSKHSLLMSRDMELCNLDSVSHLSPRFTLGRLLSFCSQTLCEGDVTTFRVIGGARTTVASRHWYTFTWIAFLTVTSLTRFLRNTKVGSTSSCCLLTDLGSSTRILHPTNWLVPGIIKHRKWKFYKMLEECMHSTKSAEVVCAT